MWVICVGNWCVGPIGHSHGHVGHWRVGHRRVGRVGLWRVGRVGHWCVDDVGPGLEEKALLEPAVPCTASSVGRVDCNYRHISTGRLSQ